jgi:hypothetical protein
MVEKYAKAIRSRAVQERSIAVSCFKSVWLSNASPFALVTNVLTTDLKNKADMAVNPALIDTGINTVDEVRGLLKSNQLYRNAAMYNLLCGGVESGKLKKIPKKGKTTISDLLTVAHEAWIRLELHYNLKEQAARHRGTKDDNTERTKEWQVFCALVFQDRDDNEEQATLDRGIAVTDSAANDDDDEEDDEAEAVPACDPKYFKRK